MGLWGDCLINALRGVNIRCSGLPKNGWVVILRAQIWGALRAGRLQFCGAVNDQKQVHSGTKGPRAVVDQRWHHAEFDSGRRFFVGLLGGWLVRDLAGFYDFIWRNGPGWRIFEGF